MMTDPISDMLARIRNASLARQATTGIPLSKLKVKIAEILQAEGFIRDFAVDGEGHRKMIRVRLKYTANRRSAISGLQRKSRPGRRYYVGHEKIPRVLSGMGVAIMSTSRGVMTDSAARDQRVGGEVLCEVW